MMKNEDINAMCDQNTDTLMIGFDDLINRVIPEPEQRYLVTMDVKNKVWAALKVGALEVLKAVGVKIDE